MAGPNYGLIDNALVGKNRALEGFGAVNALQSQMLENQAAKMGIENALAEKAAAQAAGGDTSKLVSNMMQVSPKTGVALTKGLAAARKDDVEAVNTRLKTSAALSDLAQTPEQMAQIMRGDFSDPLLGPLYQRMGLTPEKTDAMLAEASKTPEGFRQFKMQRVMGMKGMYDQLNNEAQLKVSQRNSDISAGNLAETRRAHDLQYGENVVANTVTDNAGNVTQFNRYGQVIGTPGKVGKPSAQFEKNENLKKDQKIIYDSALTSLKQIVKPGDLIDQSTHSGIGRVIDKSAQFFGQDTAGDVALAKLEPIASQVLMMQPRFEGPQSDKDVREYKTAAGDLANGTLPITRRKAAANKIVEIMERRKDQFVTQAMANEGVSAGGTTAPPSGFQLDK